MGSSMSVCLALLELGNPHCTGSLFEHRVATTETEVIVETHSYVTMATLTLDTTVAVVIPFEEE
jgi:hypothetical protein